MLIQMCWKKGKSLQNIRIRTRQGWNALHVWEFCLTKCYPLWIRSLLWSLVKVQWGMQIANAHTSFCQLISGRTARFSWKWLSRCAGCKKRNSGRTLPGNCVKQTNLTRRYLIWQTIQELLRAICARCLLLGENLQAGRSAYLALLSWRNLCRLMLISFFQSGYRKCTFKSSLPS